MNAYSLKTLLVSLLAAAFTLLAAALFAANLLHTREFLTRQLGTHAQDTATALALQLAPALQAKDQATVTNTVDALFDSGYYRRIALTTPGGEKILVRDNPLHIEGVPAWLVRLFPLDTPAGTAESLAGWQRAAVVQVVSHPAMPTASSGRACARSVYGPWSWARSPPCWSSGSYAAPCAPSATWSAWP